MLRCVCVCVRVCAWVLRVRVRERGKMLFTTYILTPSGGEAGSVCHNSVGVNIGQHGGGGRRGKPGVNASCSARSCERELLDRISLLYCRMDFRIRARPLLLLLLELPLAL